MTDWPGDYDNFLRRKEEMLNAESLENARFDKKLAQEEAWIRQGIKARRTRNEGRVRALKSMRQQRQQRRTTTGQVKMQLQESERSGKLVAEVENISYAWQGKPIIRDFSTTVMRAWQTSGNCQPGGIARMICGQTSSRGASLLLRISSIW